MRNEHTQCDLCKQPAKEIAILTVPVAWIPGGTKIPQTEAAQSALFSFWHIGHIGQIGPTNPTFDLCRPCVEGLLRSALWLKSVMETK